MENIANDLIMRAGSLTNQMARNGVLGLLDQLSDGHLEIQQDQQTWVLGDIGAGRTPVRMQIHDDSVWRDLLTGGSLGAAEAYVSGSWSSPDLVALLRLFARNLEQLNRAEDRFSWLSKPALQALHWFNRNTPSGSKRNIAAHYDLGNALFESFLDPSMMYSSAIFPRPDSSLEEASLHKLDLICRKLDLQPGQRLIEIGTGWGGFAIYAAKHYGCHVTTTTLSQEQFDWAQERVHTEGLEHLIDLRLQDYRELTGCFDRLVSIEMIEAVGPQFLPEYMAKVDELLAKDGLALIQAITLPDQRYHRALRNVDFIQRYIFPGSFIPSLGAIQGAVAEGSRLRLIQQTDYGLDYARTLACWRQRFLSRQKHIRQLGYDDRFIRLWDFYFAYCEAGFAERAIGVSQLLYAMKNYRAPLHRME